MKIRFNEFEIDIKARVIAEPGFSKKSTRKFLFQLITDYRALAEYEEKNGMLLSAAYDKNMVDAFSDAYKRVECDET